MAHAAFRRFSRALLLASACLASFALAGCHSAFVQTTVVNNTGKAIHVFEVDYPSASFGSSELASGSSYRYRFKISGSGATTLTWTDGAEHDHTAHGPTLTEGQEGTLAISITPDGATWQPQLHQAK